MEDLKARLHGIVDKVSADVRLGQQTPEAAGHAVLLSLRDQMDAEHVVTVDGFYKSIALLYVETLLAGASK